MAKTLSCLLFLAALLLPACSYARPGGGGMNVVLFDCEPGSLYVRGLVLYDIVPVLNKWTFEVDRLKPGQQKQTCQVSPTYKVTMILQADPAHSLNDEAVLIVDGDEVGLLTFDDPDKSWTYIFTTSTQGGYGNGDVDIESIATKQESTKEFHKNDHAK